MNRMLLIVDPQNDFISGSLAVPEAAKAMDKLAGWLQKNSGAYSIIALTGDQHAPDHCSFAENGGKWPSHCVRGSWGAEIYEPLNSVLEKLSIKSFKFAKAREKEEFSVFQNEANAIAIRQLVQDGEIERIDVCGIAGDICVLATLEDAGRIFGQENIGVLLQFTPSLDRGKKLAEFMSKNGLWDISCQIGQTEDGDI